MSYCTVRGRFSGLEPKQGLQGDEWKEEDQVVIWDSICLSGIIFSYCETLSDLHREEFLQYTSTVFTTSYPLVLPAFHGMYNTRQWMYLHAI